MGVLLAYSRTIFLTRYINDLEAQLQDVTEEKQKLMNEITKVTDAGDLSNSDSAAVKELNALKVRLQALDRKLDIKMKDISTRLNAATQERQSADAMLQENIRSSFSYGNQRG